MVIIVIPTVVLRGTTVAANHALPIVLVLHAAVQVRPLMVALAAADHLVTVVADRQAVPPPREALPQEVLHILELEETKQKINV